MAKKLSVTLDDIRAAHAAIGKHISPSPCVHSADLSELAGCELYMKMENLQRTGAYKDRGAMNAVLSLGPEQRKAGVVFFRTIGP